MNWYKKAQPESLLERYPNYGHIGHLGYGSEGDIVGNIVLWASDLQVNKFYTEPLKGKSDSYDHSKLFYDNGLDPIRGVYQGRYDEAKNIVSVKYNRNIFSTTFLPNRLIYRLKKEFGQNVRILDYSSGNPELVI